MSDESIRIQALDPNHSFIIQAPAGSGKTALLIQRYLTLLTHTQHAPEEVVAMTFTRKAASEMRERVIDALYASDQETPPEEPHKRRTWELAQQVRERDQALGWHLKQNPNRLRIMTLDALSAYLAHSMPLHSTTSINLAIIEIAEPYYHLAIERMLTEQTENTALDSAIETLLLHLDNRVDHLQNLLIQILKKREQWLPHIIPHTSNPEALKTQIEACLSDIALSHLQALLTDFPPDALHALIPIAQYAGEKKAEQDSTHPIAACALTYTLPQLAPEQLRYWQGIAQLLLTDKGEWRKTITQRQGIPASEKAIKQDLNALLNSLEHQNTIKTQLNWIRRIPLPHYSHDQWRIVHTLLTILPILAAQLELVFQNNACLDFIGLNLAAHRALGTEEKPTNTALYLDYQIQHLLIDEFQDTSVIQFQLIEKLLHGWEPNDGRTLFLVGDPMQSIYRFRNAEVGLFLKAQRSGIGGIHLTPLTLKKNFRSSQSIVSWNNDCYKTIFPNTPMPEVGGTPFAPSIATQTNTGTISWHTSLEDTGTQESIQMLEAIQHLQKKHPQDSIAILVRSRTHLTHILPRLHAAGIAFSAIDLEPLADTIEIQDLHALTRALLHREDRIAWLSVLRAPYCGITLRDLLCITQAAKRKTIWKVISEFNTLPSLSDDATLRLSHCVPALRSGVERQGELLLSTLLRKVWEALNGPKTLSNIKQHIHIERYFKLIEECESSSPNITIDAIEPHLKKLYAEPGTQNNLLQIMTIHKAKGLEFDHVLIPGLHRKAAQDPHQLLMWLERPMNSGIGLLLASLSSKAGAKDPIYQYLRHLEKEKTKNEMARLLYVATTRARKSLHLLASASLDKNNSPQPKSDSFLKLLWDTAKIHFSALTTTLPTPEMTSDQHTLYRLKENMFQQTFTPNDHPAHYVPSKPLQRSDIRARHIGITLHAALEHIAQGQPYTLDSIKKKLRQLGHPLQHIDHAANTINAAVSRTISDPRGQWILSSEHEDAHCELSLSVVENDRVEQLVIDRCFMDNGTRWIIDYKTGDQSPEALAAYERQLQRYGHAFWALEQRPIRLAAYFPMTGGFQEYRFTHSPEPSCDVA